MSDPDRPGFHHRSQAAVGALCPWHRHAGARTQQRLEPSQGDRATDVRVRHTKKIIDCYVALIGVWEPGDRIYLFGFSRGAYTARCLSHVLEVCGIPRNEPSGESISLDPKSLRRVAKEAVSCVYWLGMPRDSAEIDKRAEHFCSAYKSELDALRARRPISSEYGMRLQRSVATFLPKLGLRPALRVRRPVRAASAVDRRGLERFQAGAMGRRSLSRARMRTRARRLK